MCTWSSSAVSVCTQSVYSPDEILRFYMGSPVDFFSRRPVFADGGHFIYKKKNIAMDNPYILRSCIQRIPCACACACVCVCGPVCMALYPVTESTGRSKEIMNGTGAIVNAVGQGASVLGQWEKRLQDIQTTCAAAYIHTISRKMTSKIQANPGRLPWRKRIYALFLINPREVANIVNIFIGWVLFKIIIVW